MIATQHSGTGKANQYFLRGFNLDHGTDFAGFIDGVQINLRSHGHGQGYLDLNFLIPELIERINYRKGPYYADVGDFSAAGTVHFTTVDELAPLATATVGSFGYGRALVAGGGALGDGRFLAALEGIVSDGPWVLDERLRKVNGLLSYSGGGAEGWRLAFSGYHARWTSTDQVPLRAIESGLIDRFGFIDPALGGRTTRLSLTGRATPGPFEIVAYAIYYDFRLTSNFTYFLDDPVDGDEFQQSDRRGVLGGSARYRTDTRLGALPLALTFGAEARYDLIGNVGLYRSIAGERSATIREDRIDEFSGAFHASAELRPAADVRINAGLRADLYHYRVRANLPQNSGDGIDAILTPKLTLAWRPADLFELYADYGESFHSNDVRGATISVDPASGDAAMSIPALVRARGAEFGARLEAGGLTASLAAYYLTLGSELVFTGDGGSTETNAASRRFGIEANLFWRPRPGLTFDVATAWTRARLRGVEPDADRIPNSVSTVLSGGATVELGAGFTSTLRVRHFGPAPLVEDDRARSNGTSLVNLGLYKQSGRATLGLEVLNLFDVRDADITYFYASRLPSEPAEGVEDRHLHPVEPRQLRLSLRYVL